MDGKALAEYGIDYDKGLKNCMGNLPFYKKILSMFLQDQCFSLAKSAYSIGDHKELFCRMHELKGISGNAALATLYACTVPLVEHLRLDNGPEVEIDTLFAATEMAYQRARLGIVAFLAEQ